YRRHLLLGRHRRACPTRYQQLSAALHQLVHRLREFRLVVDPNDIKHDVSILDHAKFAQAKSECLNKRPVVAVGLGTNREETNPNRIFWLLCARGKRPRHGRAADKRDELAPFHSITSSARCWRNKGTSRPRALA